MPLFYQLIYVSTTFLAFVIGALVFFRRRDATVVRLFGAFIVAGICWVITLFFFYTLTDSAPLLLVGRLNFVFSELTAFFALAFAIHFPKMALRWPGWTRYAAGAVTAALALVTLTTDLVDENELVQGVSRVTEYGPLYPFFMAYIGLIIVAMVYVLIRKSRKLKGDDRTQLLLVAGGLVIGTLFAFTTNVLIPLRTGNYDVQHYGPLALLFFCLLVSYAVAKHEMLDIKILATELFVFCLLLLSVINLIVAVTPISQVVSGATLAIGMVFGALLIRQVHRDVRQRETLRVLSERLSQTNAHLQEMDATKTEFISIASHQLRTPVSVIKGYLSLLQEGAYGQLPQVVLEKLDQMYAANERLVHLINNILNMSRIEQSRLEFHCADADMRAVILEVAGEMKFKAKDKGLALEYELPPEGTPKIFSDPEKIHEILANLADNAIKYTEKGSVKLVGRLAREKGEDWFILEVIDTGMGISEEGKRRLFQRFYRIDAPGAPRQTGTGLGLYICKKFAESLGGTIVVTSTEVGTGTTFTVRLPVKPRGECAPK